MKSIPFNRILFVSGILVLTATLVFRFRMIHVPLDRDEGEFAYAGWRILNGGVPYLDFYNMKMPGIYAGYALLFLILGSTVEALRIGLILVNVCCTFFIYKLTRHWFGQITALFSAIAYLIFTSQIELQGTSFHAESCAMLFAIPAIWQCELGLERKSPARLFAAGILLGIAFLMKQPAVIFAVFAGVILLIRMLSVSENRKYFLRAAGSLVSGFLVPLLVTTLWLVSHGAGNNFKFFVFDYAREYISYLTWKDGLHNLLSVFTYTIKPNLLLWMLVPFVLVAVAFRAYRKNALVVLMFFIFSFLAVSAGYYFRPHYFQFLLPAIAILAGLSLGMAAQKYRWLSLAYLLAAIGYYVYEERSLWAIRNESEFIRQVYRLDYFNATRVAGDVIAENSTPDSRVAVFGAEPELWFYSKRLAASGYLYVYPLLENQPYAERMRNQFYSEIERSKPDILIYTSNSGTWYASEKIHQEIRTWYEAYRGSQFKRIALIDMPWNGDTRYYFETDSMIKPSNPENFIEIYKRRN